MVTWPNSNFLLLKYSRNKQMSLFTVLELCFQNQTLYHLKKHYAIQFCDANSCEQQMFIYPLVPWSNATILDVGFLLGNQMLGLGSKTWKTYLRLHSFWPLFPWTKEGNSLRAFSKQLACKLLIHPIPNNLQFLNLLLLQSKHWFLYSRYRRRKVYVFQTDHCFIPSKLGV